MMLNTPYKIGAKVFANRISSIAQQLISHHQSGFLHSSSIHCSLWMTSKMIYLAQCSDLEYIFMKADIMKAFDSIEWECLLAVLEKSNFSGYFLKYLKAIVGSANSKIYYR
jgi:hypothetical protein